ncbi:conserved hypothetical protein [Neospora caninum Liverpool]|uniref:Methyltransferase n=1 Tax=Neospora caninum (strain Liverpool) TaxID=572307 RepID=F0VP18_NEOCL|nr:conserved hypothetical protein [Neospora caninum Liverpool]CBZ55464.1 conserved hypothetical protein [Neospora caninum Liverpool]CEL70201.1 TPA: hypothetical protein BN1204_058870 [Neospora caninum Liverpool]|eukprot:XP_003885492.1 conserved hypothetical protein [Neospora caninum Liverpool]
MRAERDGLEVFQDVNVLEVGSGCGLVGMVAALLGASVTVSELEKGLPLLRHNIEAFKSEWRSQVQISCEDAATVASRLSLESSNRDLHPFRMVICSDVWADKELRSSFLLLLLKVIATDSEVLMCHTWRNMDGITIGAASVDQEQDEFMTRLSQLFDVEEIETEDTIRAYCSRFHGGSFFLRSQSTIDIQETSDADGRIVILRLTCRQAIKDNPALLEEELKNEIALLRQRASGNAQQHPVQPLSQAPVPGELDSSVSKEPLEAKNNGNAGIGSTKAFAPEPSAHKRLLSTNSSGDHEKSRLRHLRPRLSTNKWEPSASSQDQSGARVMSATSAESEGRVSAETGALLTACPGLRSRAQRPGVPDLQSAPGREPTKRPSTSFPVSGSRIERAAARPPTKDGIVSRRVTGTEHRTSQQYPAGGVRSKSNISRTAAGASRPAAAGAEAGRPGSAGAGSTSGEGDSVKTAVVQVGDKCGASVASGGPSLEAHDGGAGRRSSTRTSQRLGRFQAASGSGCSPNAGSRQKQPQAPTNRSQVVSGLSPSTGTTRSGSVDRDATAARQRHTGSATGHETASATTAANVHRPSSSKAPGVGGTGQRLSERLVDNRRTGSAAAGTGHASPGLSPSRKVQHLPSNSADPVCAAVLSPQRPGIIGRLSTFLRRSSDRGGAAGHPAGTAGGPEATEEPSRSLFRKRSISRSGCHMRKPSQAGTTLPKK